MIKITRIKTLGLDKLNNAEYTNFMSNFADMYNIAGPEKLGTSEEECQLFYDKVALMTDIVLDSRISDNTVKMEQADIKRNNIMEFIINSIIIAKKSPDEDYKECGVALSNIIKPYRKFLKLPKDQKTTSISGFITDLRKKDAADMMDVLLLDKSLKALEEANKEYAGLSMRRTTENAERKKGSSRILRADMNEMYKTMSTLAFVNSVAKPDKDVTDFISQLNAVIDRVNALYNLRKGQANRKPEEKTED